MKSGMTLLAGTNSTRTKSLMWCKRHIFFFYYCY